MELEATVQTLIANGAHIISCTGNPQSTLAKQSEVCLVAHVDEEGDALMVEIAKKWMEQSGDS